MHTRFNLCLLLDLLLAFLLTTCVPLTSAQEINPPRGLPSNFTVDSSTIISNGTDDEFLNKLVIEPLITQSNATTISLEQVTTIWLGRPVVQTNIWGFTYDRDSVQSLSDNNTILFALPVDAIDLQAALQYAFDIANSSLPANLTGDGQLWQTRNHGLSVIMAAYNQTSIETGNWVFKSAIQSMLDAIPEKTGNTTSVVGVLRAPDGAPFADFAVTYQRIIYKSRVAVHPSAAIAEPYSPSGEYSLLAKREDRPIPHTSLFLQIQTGTVQLTKRALLWVARYAYDSMKDRNNVPPEGLTGYVQHDLVEHYGASAVFSLQTRGTNRIQKDDLEFVLRAIYHHTLSYLRNSPGPGMVLNVQGRILNQAGSVIANWAIGKEFDSLIQMCPSVLVENPDDSHAMGCVIP